MMTTAQRMIATATAATIAITAIGITPVLSAPAAAPPTQALEKASDGFTEVAKRRRYYRGGNAAAAAAFLGIAGTIATLAARDRYYRYYGGYYAPRHYYAPRYRYYRGW
jgi:hypothetical protein